MAFLIAEWLHILDVYWWSHYKIWIYHALMSSVGCQMSLKITHIAAPFVIAISDFWCVYTGTHALLKSNPEYDQKRHELFEHYYPIEICPTLPANEKAKYMEEWYVMQTHCNSTGPPSH